MLATFRTMTLALTSWRSQVYQLALNVMHRQTHGTALGWLWLFVRPFVYVFSFWFALSVGLKGAKISGVDDVTYVFWLTSGIFPWFYLQTSIRQGANLFNRYSYLVNKVKFPVPLIPVFHELGQLFIHLLLIACITAAYFFCGGSLDIYALQLPLIIVLMYIFGVGWSLLASSFTAFSKDIFNLIKAFMTPLFWLSGILFDVSSLGLRTIKTVLYFNPVTFLVTSYRHIFVNNLAFKGWIWDDPYAFCIGIAVIFLTLLAGLFVYSRAEKDIPDVL